MNISVTIINIFCKQLSSDDYGYPFNLQVSVSTPIWLESAMPKMPMSAWHSARTLLLAAISLSSNTTEPAWPTPSASNLILLALTALLEILPVMSNSWAAMKR